MDSIQAALTESRRRLGGQNLSLETHWQRSVKYDSVCKILGDVEALNAIPTQVHTTLHPSRKKDSWA